jgi:hypothetical protein
MNLTAKLISMLIPSLGILTLATVNAPRPTPKVQDQPARIRVITYADNVALILNNNCVKCHRAGENAPFSLEGYANAKRYSEMIAMATSKRIMPPWKAQPGDVEFKDDAHLTDEQIAMLQAWADSGALRGDKAKEPAPLKFAKGWANGEPDLLLKMPYSKEISAEGEDEYWNFIVSPDIKEPVWISGMDVAPGNKNIVHHVIAYTDKSGRGRKLAVGPKGDGKLGYRSSGGGVGFNPDGALGGWAPGAHGHLLPEDAGFLLEPGTDIILQVHYNKSGKVEADQTTIALYTNKTTPKHAVDLEFLANPFIRIQPNKADQKFKFDMPLPAKIRGQEVSFRLYNLMPHMHLLGQTMKATAILPDKSEKILIDLKNWDFNWQLVYTPVQPIDLPGGTIIRLEATYDNTTDNPFQPHDPPKLTTWGEETTDEMMLLVSAIAVIPKQ